MTDREHELFERALILIMGEWDKTREQALRWVSDDNYDWYDRFSDDLPLND